MSSISLRNITKRFGDFTAVSDLNLEIADGEFLALLGPSGCGKTTTMNMVAGIESATSGDLFFDGKPPTAKRIQDRGIGFVFQNYAIFTHMTVRENLAFSLTVKQRPQSEIDQRVTAMAKRMSIDHRLDQLSGKLSVNEMQKVAIARSAIAEPKVFLLDEPLSNLDASFRAYMRAELKILQHEFKQTMVYVTHDQIEAMSLADRIAIMDRGKLMQVGAPLDVYNNPANIFVAQFVGSPAINLLEGKLITQGGNSSLHLNGGETISLPPTLAKNFVKSSTDRVVLGIRAQDVKAGSQNSANGVLVHGIVEVIERIGPVRVAHVHTPAGVVKCMQGVDATHVGEALTVSLPESSCLAFDAASGNRLNFMGH